MKQTFFFLLLTLAVCSYSQGTGWVLDSEEGGIKVYTKPTLADGTMQMRVIGSTTASIQAVMKVTQNVSAIKERIINTKSVTTLKEISSNDIYYHLISDYPWPLTDRDAIMHLTISQNPTTKVIRADTYSSPSYIAESKDYVRIYTWETHNISTPKPNGTVEIDYWFKYNPRGSVPTSLKETITKDGTIKGMKNFIKLTHEAKYQ